MRRAGLTLVVSFLLLGCTTGEPGKPGAPGAPGAPAAPAATGKYASAPPQTLDPAKAYAATLVTTKGTIELSLDAKAAPITVNNFVFLARDHFYDGLAFHRVVPGFVIQGGDPEANGLGGPGYTIPDEASPLVHVEGALAMARAATPNSAGSQFYVTLAAQPSLDGKYTVFGQVTAGMDVVKTIVVGDIITRATITESPAK
jgi:cyclophilin family peptidyl-prolyl cis-trans isomerase